MPEFCEHSNISYNCYICYPNYDKMVKKLLTKAKAIQEVSKYVDEGFRCKYCDLEVRTKPSRKTYDCNICIQRSYKDKDPPYVFPRFDWEEGGLEYWMSWLPRPAEILRFRRERWNKIPPWRQQEILEEVAKIIELWKFYNRCEGSWNKLNQNLQQFLLNKVKLSAWYLQFYENWFIFLAMRPGFCKIPKKIFHRGRWITE